MFTPGKYRLIKEGPRHHLPAHRHAEHHTLIGVSGAMKVRVESKAFTLSPGDELTIAPHVEHEAWVSPDGCSYLWIEY